MKERMLYGEDFEKQLKDKTDQFKMYPSDKVWNEVHSSLHNGRRKFVAGMAILIGSFLIIAGSQLIFSSRPVNAKLVETKKFTASKPNTVLVLHNFTGKVFSSSSTMGTSDAQGNEGNLNASIPFGLSSFSSDQPAANVDMTETVREKSMTAINAKPLEEAELNVSSKPSPTTGATDVDENVPSALISPAMSIDLEESSPEKISTQSAHLHNDRLSWELYVTPTLNTHYLTGLNYQHMGQSLQSAPVMLVNISNVNGFVDNTPVLGYNIGGDILYHISKNISLKAGLEFSFNRYYIRAYNSGSSQTSVALNSYFGYVADSLNASFQSTGTEKNPQHYQNKYYQVSLPVGVDIKVAGNENVQLHIGASLQPSYLLNTDAYVLSADYKGYTKDPQAFRRWNLNAGAEAFISFPVGNVRWELGPQIRYQVFSTYKNSYPFQENMLSYGFRIGISKTIR